VDWEPQDPDYVNAGMEKGYLCKHPTVCEHLRTQLSAANERIKELEKDRDDFTIQFLNAEKFLNDRIQSQQKRIKELEEYVQQQIRAAKYVEQVHTESAVEKVQLKEENARLREDVAALEERQLTLVAGLERIANNFLTGDNCQRIARQTLEGKDA